MGFGLIGPTPYSRESTPDSGGSHYIDNFRDPSGENKNKKNSTVHFSVVCLFLFYEKQVIARTPLMEWLCNQITQTVIQDMGLMLISVAALMEALWAQVSIQYRLYLVHIPPLRHRAMQCHPHSTCHRMTNCSQRTGECLEREQEIKLFILRKPFLRNNIYTRLYMYINLQYYVLKFI